MIWVRFTVREDTGLLQPKQIMVSNIRHISWLPDSSSITQLFVNEIRIDLIGDFKASAKQVLAEQLLIKGLMK